MRCSAARWGARTSAAAFADALGMPVQALDDLSEVDHGELSGLTHAEIAAAWPGQAEARARDKYFYRFPGGESYADADARAGRALAWIARSGVRAPLLVSHEMIGRILLKNLAGLGRLEALRLSHSSDMVYRCVPHSAPSRFSRPGLASAIRYNQSLMAAIRTAHKAGHGLPAQPATTRRVRHRPVRVECTKNADK
jgi:broad specificity phosphatase PhoE